MRNSRKVYIPVYFMVLAIAATLIIVKYKELQMGSSILVLAILFIIFGIKSTEVHRFSNLYSISPSAVTLSSGIFGRSVKSIDLFAISDINVYQNFWQRILNFGDVHISLFSDISVIKNINKPVKFGDFLEKTIDKRRGQAEW